MVCDQLTAGCCMEVMWPRHRPSGRCAGGTANELTVPSALQPIALTDRGEVRFVPSWARTTVKLADCVRFQFPVRFDDPPANSYAPDLSITLGNVHTLVGKVDQRGPVFCIVADALGDSDAGSNRCSIRSCAKPVPHEPLHRHVDALAVEAVPISRNHLTGWRTRRCASALPACSSSGRARSRAWPRPWLARHRATPSRPLSSNASRRKCGSA